MSCLPCYFDVTLNISKGKGVVMYYVFGMFAGICVAFMISFNNLLSQAVGVYAGTLIYHFLALIIISVYIVLTKQAKQDHKLLPFYFYLPGVASVLTVMSSSISVSNICLRFSKRLFTVINK
jgi:uncharacterized membrane protein YdcZ (DUF606 family)